MEHGPEPAPTAPRPPGAGPASRPTSGPGRTTDSDNENDAIIQRSKSIRKIIDSSDDDETLSLENTTKAVSDKQNSDDSVSDETPRAHMMKSSRNIVHSEDEVTTATNKLKSNSYASSTDNDGSQVKENKLSKKRVIRGLSDSENEDSPPMNFFQKKDSTRELQERIRKAIGSASSSDDEDVTSKRNIRSKMLDKFKNRFQKSKKNKDNLKPIEKAEFENEIKTLKPWSSLCDKDTSSSDSGCDDPLPHLNSRPEFSNDKPKKQKHSPKNKHKQETKPKQMSARDAMENMTKIKSESNRMLREREVSLPYHRPKHITLQDILQRRKLAVGSDGKPLPLKMNEEQLKQYAQQLEERRKEMEELYKSDNEEDEDEEHSTEPKNNYQCTGNVKDILLKTNSTNSTSHINASNTDNFNDDYLKNINKVNMKVDEMEKYSDNLFDSCTEITTEIAREETEKLETIANIIVEETKSPISNSEGKEANSEHYTNVDSQLISLNFNSENTNVETQEYITNNKFKESDPSVEPKESDLNVGLDTNDLQTKEFDTNDLQTKEFDTNDLQTKEFDTNDIVLESVTTGDCFKVKENISKESNITTESITEENIKTKCSDKGKQDENIEINTIRETTTTSAIDIQEEKDQSTEAMVLTFNESDRSINEEYNTNRSLEYQDMVKEIKYSFDDDFPDDDVDMSHVEEIMNRIENGKDHAMDSPSIVNDVSLTNGMEKDMTIDLGWAPSTHKRQTGVELLKQRFLYFSNMKTPEEQDREKWTKYKPGAQRFKLMQELEKQGEEQSAAEWAKKLEEEKQREQDLKELNGEDSESEDELEKLEKKCAEQEECDGVKENGVLEKNNDKDKHEDVVNNGEEQENEDNDEEHEEKYDEQEEETDDLNDDKTKKRKLLNPLIDDEAEVEDDEDSGEDDDSDENDVETASSDEVSSSSEEEAKNENSKQKKGRIIKAFEDSDDENDKQNNENVNVVSQNNIDIVTQNDNNELIVLRNDTDGPLQKGSTQLSKTTDDMFASQSTQADEEFPLAQRNVSISEDMSTSEEPTKQNVSGDCLQLSVLCETQPNSEVDLGAIVGLCSGKFPSDSQPDIPPAPLSINRMIQSDTNTQTFGEDVIQLCSGKFDEHFVVTQTVKTTEILNTLKTKSKPEEDSAQKFEDHKCIRELLDEFDEKEINDPVKNKYFGINGGPSVKEVRKDKGKLVLMSSDEENAESEAGRKKKKRKKRDKRKLHISDDEEEEVSEAEQNIFSKEEIDNDEEGIVDYDSEENEVEVGREAYKRRAADFLEKEAELSSEDEWAGSGDEDERGPDRLEREEGDDDVFHEGELRRELGLMHMQDMLEEDKREVRMLQEILLEDEDLVGPQRQRQFRWRDTDDAEEQSGTVADMFGDTPGEEDESEALWRKQRHERNMFLKKLAEEQKCNENEDTLNLDFGAPLMKTSIQSSLLVDGEINKVESKSVVVERSQTVELAGRMEGKFSILQRHRGSFLNRDSTYLQRLAALTEPIAGTTDEPVANLSSLAPGKKRTFVFATLTPPPARDDDHSKINKRKAEGETGTPKVVKKQRINQPPKKSLLDFLD